MNPPIHTHKNAHRQNLLFNGRKEIRQNETEFVILMRHRPFDDLEQWRCNLNRLTLNPLAPGRSECNSRNGIFNLVLLIGMFRSSHDNALRWMPQDLTDDKSTLVQVMAWCHQATSHYLSQCWPRSLLPYGVTRPQWVKQKSSTYEQTSMIVNQNSNIFFQENAFENAVNEMATIVSWPQCVNDKVLSHDPIQWSTHKIRQLTINNIFPLEQLQTTTKWLCPDFLPIHKWYINGFVQE